MNAAAVRDRLASLAQSQVAKSSARFFKTGPGEYGEGDHFIGVRVPELRKLVREFRELPEREIADLLVSPIHEERLMALLILVWQFEHAEPSTQRTIYDFFWRHKQHVNNWDLVDSSAPPIVGGYLHDKSRRPLLQLAKSPTLWDRRIAIVATQFFIRQGDFDDTLKISQQLLADSEDLIHKATGWMLREVGKKDEAVLRAFLDQHAREMPRTMLRYAIERLPPTTRQAYLRQR